MPTILVYSRRFVRSLVQYSTNNCLNQTLITYWEQKEIWYYSISSHLQATTGKVNLRKFFRVIGTQSRWNVKMQTINPVLWILYFFSRSAKRLCLFMIVIQQFEDLSITTASQNQSVLSDISMNLPKNPFWFLSHVL